MEATTLPEPSRTVVAPSAVAPSAVAPSAVAPRSRAVGSRAVGSRSSMGSVGDGGDGDDNAMAESFFATVECELLSHSSFPTPAEARAALFEFIEIFSNRQRRHSALGSLSPDAFERRFLETLVVA